MDVNKLAGGALIILGVVNVLHEFVVRSTVVANQASHMRL